MYATISDLIKDLFGIYIPLPIQTFGFFVAISFLLGAYTIVQELKRKESLGLIKAQLIKVNHGKPSSILEWAGSLIFGFLIGYKLLLIFTDYSGFSDDPQGYILSAKGNFVGGLIGLAISYYFKNKEEKQKKSLTGKVTEELQHPHELVGTITIIAAIFGLLGAKIFHNLENLDDLMRDPIDALISFSGLTMYGGLIMGGAAVLVFAKRNGIDWKHMCDAAAPGLMLSYGTGRIGCQMSGDGDWGIDNLAAKPDWLSMFPDWVWAYKYPNNVLGEGVPIEGCIGKHCAELANPVFPTPLYEAVACILLFFVLWSFRKKITAPFMMFSIYMVLNGVERFFIEKIRINTLYHTGTFAFTQAELISSLLIIGGLVGIFLSMKWAKENKSSTMV